MRSACVRDNRVAAVRDDATRAAAAAPAGMNRHVVTLCAMGPSLRPRSGSFEVGSMMVVGTGMTRVIGLGVLLAMMGGPVSVLGSRRRSSGNDCNQGRGYCVQWTNHSRNPNSYRNPMGAWECKHGQMAIGFPDEITHAGMQDASGNAIPATYRQEVEHRPDSQWADDNRKSGRCKGCGCECDVVRAPLPFDRGALASMQHL
eukprot:COSAG02_NODE_848_length_16553_cov_21.228577_12_plen_202_part_00